MRWTARFAVICTLALGLPLAACSDDDSSAPPDLALDAGHDARSDALIPPDKTAAVDAGPSAVGTACTTGATPQGSCPKGYLCYPSALGMPAGYCTRFCSFGASCPSDAVCAMSPTVGEFCLKACKDSKGCRAAEGYLCDADWKGCAGPSVLLSPVLKKCAPISALPRLTFGKVTQLSTKAGPGKYNMEPAAALNAAGDLTAVYMARNQTTADGWLGVSTLKANGTLNGDRSLKGKSKHLFDPWMAADRAGKMYLVYFGHDGQDTNSLVGLVSSSDGAKWSAEQVVHDTADCPGNMTGCLDKTMIAVGPQVGATTKDAIYVFYFSGPGGGMKMVRSLDSGKTFGKSVKVGKGAYGDAEVSSDGVIHVVYLTSLNGNKLGDTKNWIEYTRSVDGGKTFATALKVSAAGEAVPFYFSNAQVAANPAKGSIHVVYPTGGPDGAWDIRLATSTDAGKTWSRLRVNDDPQCANHMIPTIALDPATGKLHVAWAENRGGVGQIAYAACDADGKKCSANEAISHKPFADYQLVRHSPRWLGEYFELLVDSSKKALHAVWTQPVTEGGLAISRIFHARGKL